MTPESAGAAPALTPEYLGFAPIADDGRGWQLNVRNRTLRFRLLEHLDELEPIDDIQRLTMGTSEYDLIPASELVVVPETGGYVLAVFAPESDEMLAAGFAWGGFFAGKPRLVSDFLGVRAEARSLGIGEAVKRLQAALAARDGFEEIVWTVDPLRAANARLNFSKLGATCHHFERNRYGETFGAAHYGGLPTDRLHLTWDVRSERVRDLLTDRRATASFIEDAGGDVQRLVPIPADIDRVLATSRELALDWRLSVRQQIESLVADGWYIDGFVPARSHDENPALVFHRRN